MPELPAESRTTKRIVLFLQGPPTPFWRELARAFEQNGHRTHRINLCIGDWLFGRGQGVNYRGRLAGWRAFLEAFIQRHGVTDVLYYADRHPYHRIAIEVAEALGIVGVSVEFGYLRPDWLTLERGGMGARSHFPNDPQTIRAIAAAVPAPDLAVRYTHAFLPEAAAEVTYHLSTFLLRPVFPHYQADRYYNPIVEYLSWLPKLIREGRARRQAEEAVRDYVGGRAPFMLVALQLQSDYQIRANSPYRSLDTMIEEVVASFARHAPTDLHLVFKLHPLENGMEDWPKAVARHAARQGVADRVVLIDGGDLSAMIAHARGCVVINSTVGLHAIRSRCPTKVLGLAVYDLPGLTHRGPLDSFWTTPDPVDAGLAQDFVRALAATIQVKGSFYDRPGRQAGQREIVRRVAAGLVNEPCGFVPVPPRLDDARRMGLPA